MFTFIESDRIFWLIVSASVLVLVAGVRILRFRNRRRARNAGWLASPDLTTIDFTWQAGRTGDWTEKATANERQAAWGGKGTSA